MSFHNSSSNLEDEIHESVLFREFCDVIRRTHRLAGVQVWGTPWHKQYGVYGCRSLSSVKDHYCYIVYPASTIHMDPNIYGFNNVCFKHRLIEGEGVVGRAFATQQPWFSTNVSSIPKSEYPLSECACMFGLSSAIAVPLQIIHTHRSKNFVSEFFLPFDCTGFDEQMKTVTELISTLRFCVEAINKKRVNFPEIQLVLEPINEYEQYKTFSKYLLLQEENRREALDKILLPEPSYRNKMCLEIAPSTNPADVFADAIGRGSILSMAVTETRHATGKETINIPGTSLKDATTKSTGDEQALSLLAARPSKSGPSDELAYSAALQIQKRSRDNEEWNQLSDFAGGYILLDNIEGVIVEACKKCTLRGAQVWGPCNEQSPKYGCRLSDENQHHCHHVTPIVVKNFLTDHRMYGFIQACSEHGRLIKGEGVVGKAFATNEPWFSTDISSIPKTDYPLSEHARMFGMHSAVAIPLHIINRNSTITYVYEFFLPYYCTDLEEQMKTLTALILTLQQGVEKIRKTNSFPEFQLVLKPVNRVEYSLGYIESSSFPEENLSGPSSDRRLLLEPSYENNQYPDQTPSIEPAKAFEDAISQGSFLSMAVNETSHGRGEKTINVPVTGLKFATVKGTGGKSTRSVGIKRDWAWQYCSTIEGNSNGVECSFCGLEIKGGGITRFKSHIYDGDPCKNVKKCKNVHPDDKVEIEKRMKGGYNKRK